MKKYLKSLGIMLTLVLAVTSLSGCQGGNSSNQVTLQVWGDTDNQAVLENSFKEINEAFEKKYPEIKLDYQYSGSLDSINVAVQSDSLPDVFWVQGNKSTRMAEMAANGYLLPLNSYNLDSSRFPDVSIEYSQVDGETYCSYPSFFDYVCIYYNKDIFEKHSLSEPTTWDEFVNVMDTISKAGEETPLAVGGRGDFDRYWIMQAMAPTLFNETLGAIENREANIDFTPMAKAFDYFADFAKNGYFGEEYIAIDGSGAQLSFTTGKAAMIPDGTWNNTIYEDTGLNIGRFALPSYSGEKFSQSGPSNYNTYAISSKTKNPDAAVKYVDFLNSKETQEIIQRNLGTIPLVTDLNIENEAVKEMAAYDTVGYNIYHVLSGVATESSRPQDVFLGECLAKLMMGEIDGQTAVDMIIAEMEKAN